MAKPISDLLMSAVVVRLKVSEVCDDRLHEKARDVVLGAEVQEKRIAELEEENASLRAVVKQAKRLLNSAV